MENKVYEGPTMALSEEIDKDKYRQPNETFDGKVKRISAALADNDEHKLELEDILGNMRFLPAGRVQSAMGANRITTAYNCFVSGTIEDSMNSIMHRAGQAAETMRRGGGIGYDFSSIRPKGDIINSLQSISSGPISFMNIFDAVCQTISSSGHRRGAQMGVLRIDHPDIEEFIVAKRNSDKLTGFNVSIGVTDKFMKCLENGELFELVFEGKVYKEINPKELWDIIMQSTWDWAEPGILFIDRINEMNNLYYCETIAATNPCGEQPLPPYGACLLGSFNLTKYIKFTDKICKANPLADYSIMPCIDCDCPLGIEFNFDKFKKDIPEVVRAMDNVIDRTIYPLKEQEDEAKNKRRMGLGVTGVANAGELLGLPYATPKFNSWLEKVLTVLRNETYKTSAYLAKEKGAFPLYREEYNNGKFINTLPYSVKSLISKYGIRNSHLTSTAPTGTISLVANNISSGIEPPFMHYYERTLRTENGIKTERIEDYAYSLGSLKSRTANDISVQEHLQVLALTQNYMDSAVSKTCNVSDEVTFDEFKSVYYDAWKMGCKGITTFRAAGKRYGILNEVKEDKVEACFIDPETGMKECG